MPEGWSKTVTPLSAVLERIRFESAIGAPAECLGRATPFRQLIQDYRPMAESLEWRLAELHWVKEGVTPSVESGVPYLVNNTGTLSANVAAMVFASCAEAPPDDVWHIVELGDISPPISDPVFGMYAILTPATGPSPAGSA